MILGLDPESLQFVVAQSEDQGLETKAGTPDREDIFFVDFYAYVDYLLYFLLVFAWQTISTWVRR